MFAEGLKRHDLKCALMRGCEDDVGSRAVRMRSQPVGCCHAPPVARREPGESVLGHWRDQVIADLLLMIEKLGGDYRADRVATSVLGTGAAAPVTKEAGDRVRPAGFECAAQHVELSHEP
jgi:hypothetical protein